MTTEKMTPPYDGDEPAPHQATFEIQHESGSVEVEVEPDLPDEAYRMLFEFDPKPGTSSRYRYDRRGRRWVEL